MEFGRVSASELELIDFSLPHEPKFNLPIYSSANSGKTNIYIGCAKWGREEWVGKIYPEGTKEKDFLNHYSKHYNAIEMNATHYRIWPEKTIKSWVEKVNSTDFIFCPKMYQDITHWGKLSEKQDTLNAFLASVSHFGRHLGPIFIQFSDHFSHKKEGELFQFLETLPTDISFFLELRHSDWFQQHILEATMNKLRRLNIGAVMTDTAGRREVAHMHLPTSSAFIRYVGNSLHGSDYQRIEHWVEKMGYWIEKGISNIYFFMHMHNEATSPELTIYLAERIEKNLGIHILKPQFIPKSSSKELFS